MDLYLVRHGQTEWNKQGVMQGRLDSPLTELGRKQAYSLAQRLAHEHYDAVYASPTPRAHNTARIIFQDRDVHIGLDERLREIYMGDWEGLTFETVQAREAEQFDHFCNRPHLFNKAGAETYQELFDRVSAFIRDLEAQHMEQKVLVVTHGATLLGFIMHYKKENLADFWEWGLCPPASLTHISVHQNEAEVISFGDNSHYQGVLDES